jgi:predicted DNA-binding ribbon-helix-helix protein
MEDGLIIVRDQAREPRVVQFGGRRYSVRLEAVFWRVLERLAAGRQMRLGKLIGELASAAQAENLTSFLRVYCMLEIERQAARAVLSSPARGLFEVLGASPAPAAVLSRERTVVAMNKCMVDWLDPRRHMKVGDVFTEIFQVRSTTPFSELWRSMMVGSAGRIKARLIYVVPGRVSTVEATFVYCGRQRDRNAYVAVWLNAGGRPAAIVDATKSADDNLPANGDLPASME